MTNSPVVVKTSHYFTAAVALVAAMSWNTAVRETIEYTWPLPKSRIAHQFVYAIMVTLLLVFIITILPNTVNELPKDVQKKLKSVETQNMNDRLSNLENKLFGV
jgi:ABC-type multidrug transport system fused ATPase/permease subunit